VWTVPGARSKQFAPRHKANQTIVAWTVDVTGPLSRALLRSRSARTPSAACDRLPSLREILGVGLVARPYRRGDAALPRLLDGDDRWKSSEHRQRVTDSTRRAVCGERKARTNVILGATLGALRRRWPRALRGSRPSLACADIP